MRTLAIIFAALLALAAFPAMTAAAEGSPSLADIEDEVMCVECGTPLNLSTSGVADREREFIEREIAAGKSKEEIKDGLVERFGPSVLAVPDDEGFGLAAYLVPALVVLAALVAVVLAARRWRRRPAGGEPTQRPLATEDTDRLDRELAALDDD